MRRTTFLRSILITVTVVAIAGTAHLQTLTPVPSPFKPSPAAQDKTISAPDIDDFTSPIEGLKQSDILDTFNQARPGGRRHEATDILAPRGTPVRAVTSGVIGKLFRSRAGGNTIYLFDPSETYCYYYAHLDQYAAGLHQGQSVVAGEVIGYVGTTGNADPNTPHLHFAIFQLGPDKNWWEGTPIDPYTILMQHAGY